MHVRQREPGSLLVLRVTNNKTGVRLWLPFTANLRAPLRAMPRQSLHYILSDKCGRQVRYDLIQKKILKIKKTLGLEEDSLHGLRYSAAGELAEAGCTDHKIAAITGHKSLSMIQKNSRGASQKILAKQAQALREQNKT